MTFGKSLRRSIGEFLSRMQNGACRLGGYFRQQQEQDNWCWAAVAASVAAYYGQGGESRQCSLVNTCLRRSVCCTNGKCAECDETYHLDRALASVGHLDTYDSRPFSQVEIWREVCRDHQPLGVRVQWWEKQQGHFIAVTGVIHGSERVIVEDPWSGYFEMSREELEQRYQGHGTWTHSYTTMAQPSS